MASMLKDISEQITELFLDAGTTDATCPLKGITSLSDETARMQEIEQRHLNWLKAVDFKPRPGQWALLPGEGGVIEGAVYGVEETPARPNPLALGLLPSLLPPGDYHFGGEHSDLAVLAWALGSYAFRRYLSADAPGKKRLRLPDGVSREDVVSTAAAVWLARDLINTPANDLGPAELAEAVCNVAQGFNAECKVIVGDDLLTNNFPLIHAVGRASTAARAPRLIEMVWGETGAPTITLVGKGICFDSGGLDIKPSPSMLLMKKDMGGAATALALAAMIMNAGLRVRLRLIIAAAENAVSSNAFRPGDIVKSRNGMTVEIGNTDAEGRLVLADALALADVEKPDYLFSFATLTGAARVALGPDLPPVYATDDKLAKQLIEAGLAVGDPMWPMPFWAAYDSWLESKTADISNVATDAFAGSITAALFLKHFVKEAQRYIHFDIFGWTPKPQAGKPLGGEPQCARAVFEYLKGQFTQR
jgi:leucyl aminopeptidase